MSDYRQFFKRARLEKRLSQRQIAEAIGLSNEQKISEIERGRAHYPLCQMTKIAVLLGLDLDQFVRLILGEQKRMKMGTK